jgi:hypothetical protein
MKCHLISCPIKNLLPNVKIILDGFEITYRKIPKKNPKLKLKLTQITGYIYEFKGDNDDLNSSSEKLDLEVNNDTIKEIKNLNEYYVDKVGFLGVIERKTITLEEDAVEREEEFE